jgi:anaphase-promoting complex subunit 4
LIGISKFHKLNHILGLETRDLQQVVDTLDSFHLLAHKILIHSGRELSQFLAFSAWLRHEINVQTAEPMSQTQEELLEKCGLIDHEKTLEYIAGPLTKSSLGAFIQIAPPFPGMPVTKSQFDLPEAWTPAGHDSCFFETYKRLIKQHEAKGDIPQENSLAHLPKLNDFTRRLEDQCSNAFQKIASTLRRDVLHRCLLSLGGDCSQECLDMAMQCEVGGQHIFTESCSFD